jgi:hypothetical protein
LINFEYIKKLLVDRFTGRSSKFEACGVANSVKVQEAAGDFARKYQ